MPLINAPLSRAMTLGEGTSRDVSSPRFPAPRGATSRRQGMNTCCPAIGSHCSRRLGPREQRYHRRVRQGNLVLRTDGLSKSNAGQHTGLRRDICVVRLRPRPRGLDTPVGDACKQRDLAELLPLRERILLQKGLLPGQQQIVGIGEARDVGQHTSLIHLRADSPLVAP